MHQVHTEIQFITDRLTREEVRVTSLGERVEIMEKKRGVYVEMVAEMQLQIEELEDRSRRCNLRLRGVPEGAEQENLQEKVMSIFHKVLEGRIPANMELDRVHRALGPKSLDPQRPWDIICRLHCYAHKETLLRKAWEAGTIEVEGTVVKILPDLSRATLQRKAMLRIVLECVQREGYTYRWRYPLAVVIRKGSSTFTLRFHSDLPKLCAFLSVESFQVPNWRLPLPQIKNYKEDNAAQRSMLGDPK